MKKKKIYILIPLILVIIVIFGIIIYKNVFDETKLTSDERKWLNENINNVSNVYVAKDENIFSKDGNGVFYSFIEDFENEYKMDLNPISIAKEENVSGIKFEYTKSLTDNDTILFTDHYVLVSKKNQIITDTTNLKDKSIGSLNSELDYINNYLKNDDLTFNGYDNIDDLFAAIEKSTIDYLILPRVEYLDMILSNNLDIVYHFSDIKNYYVIRSYNDYLSNIFLKYYKKYKDNIDKYIKDEEFNIFINSLNITDSDIDKMLSVDYTYGFINNSPYEVIMSGNYGGIIAEYLEEFSNFTNITFDIKKYKNINKLANAINKNEVDLYFSFSPIDNDNYNKTTSGIISSLSIVTPKDSNKVFETVYGLKDELVYVEKDSILESYLKTIEGINIETYSNSKELFSLNKKDVIIVMDSYIFDYYNETRLDNYTSKYNTTIDSLYTFNVTKENGTIYTLLNRYISYLDSKDMVSKGLYSHEKTIKKGNIILKVAEYLIFIIIIFLSLWFVIYHNSKKIRVAKRIKKDDKIRFIDELTCLKNRTYLNDSLSNWNNNKVYPQAIVVMDLNKLKDINDLHGVNEGDKQIQAAANILIKTQLDNSDLIRSDGNEFIIYTIGYDQKKIANYLQKLKKELRKLPYEFGAEFGCSFITDNLKTVEDALNEATNEMKNKKEINDEKK